MNNAYEHEFCMSQFKPVIAGLAVLLVGVLAWTTYHCTRHPKLHNLNFVAAKKPMGPPILAKDKMLHPYWGNCNKCHVTTDAGKPISKVMAGPPIAIKDKMLHKYWGNCVLCHTVTDGFQPQNTAGTTARAAAFTQYSAESLGLKVQPVTAAVMQKFGLANEDGVLVLAVTPGSPAAFAGLQQGDEIIRIGKVRLDTTTDFTTALNAQKPGTAVKMNIYRGTKTKNIYLDLPGGNTTVTAVPAPAPMTQNRVETLAEQFGVAKTPQAVAQAMQNQGQPVAVINFGKVAVAATGPGMGYSISPQFSISPYFVVFDPSLNQLSAVINPNANDLTGQGTQTGQFMVDLGVSNVVAGSFDMDALNTLHTLRVNVYSGVTGTVQDVLNAYAAKRLVPANTGPVQGSMIQQPGSLYMGTPIQAVY